MLLAIQPGFFTYGGDRIAEPCLRGTRDLACGQQQAVSMEVADLLVGTSVHARVLCRVQKIEHGIQCGQ